VTCDVCVIVSLDVIGYIINIIWSAQKLWNFLE